MADEERPLLGALWTEPPPLRRSARGAASTGLPAAAPIPRAPAAATTSVHRGRLIAGFTAVIAIGIAATTAAVLVPSPGITEPAALAGIDFGDAGTVSRAGEGPSAQGGPRDAGRGGEQPTDADEHTGTAQDGPDGGSALGMGPAPDAGSADDAQAPEPGAPHPSPSAPAAPGPSDPGPSTPSPAPSAPAEPAPLPSAPPVPQPEPTPPPPEPAAPAPLGFVGLVEHYTSILFIKVLSSYTLSLSGEPGATASVTYGSRSAGSVTFDGGGRASIRLGQSLIDLGLSNPLIRVAYSDGTAGAAIEARRDAI